jgi:hypothetical protein
MARMLAIPGMGIDILGSPGAGSSLMTWKGPVWREAGNYGAVGGFVPRQDLGTHTFPSQPETGQIVQVWGQEWIVVSQELGYIVVKPRVMKALGER